jgi:hypothetical protein
LGEDSLDVEQAEAMQKQTDDYIRSVANGNSYRGVDKIVRAQQLLSTGAINQDEFDQIKKRVLAETDATQGRSRTGAPS